MNRREISKREKQRALEKELDEQLQEAGIELQGMSYEEKKEIFAMLEESRKSAAEEETQRQKIIANEERILTETLNISSSCIEDAEGAEETEVTDSTEGKKDAEVRITSGSPAASQVGEADCISSSNSSTPDFLPLPSESPSKPIQFQSPHRLSGKSMSKSQSSEDLFLFSQTSTKLGVDENVIKNCIETIRVSESEDDDDDDDICIPFKNSLSSPVLPRIPLAKNSSSSPVLPSSPLVKNSSSSPVLPSSPLVKNRTPDKQKLSDITSSGDGALRNSPVAEVSPVQPRPSLRRYRSNDDVDMPKSRILSTNTGEAKSSSQPVVQRQLRNLMDGLNSEADVSPVIGQRRKLAANKAGSSIQDSEVSDSLSARPVLSSSPDLIFDDEVCGTVLSSRSSQTVAKEDNEVHSSLKANVPDDDVLLNTAGKRKMALRDDNVSGEVGSRGQLIASPERVTPRIVTTRGQNKLTFQGPNLFDSDEEYVIEKKKDGKKNIDVFVTSVHDMTLKRKLEKCEDPRRAYFKNTSENLTQAYERILDLIDKSFSTLEEYQRTLPCRMPWPMPIRADKRVKDSLDHPKVSSRRNVEVSHSIMDVETTRMVTRHKQPKTSETMEEGASLSEDSLPDPGDDGSEWYDAGKCKDKRRGIQMGLSRKRARYDSSEKVEDKQKAVMNSLAVGNESDSEDFDVPVAKISRLTPALRQREVASLPKASGEGSSSSSSNMQPSLGRRGARINSGKKLEDKPKVAVSSLTMINESDSEDLDVPVTRSASPLLRQRAMPTPLKDSNTGSFLSKIKEEDQTNFDLADILADSQVERGSTSRDDQEEKASTSRDGLAEKASMSRRGLLSSQADRKKIGIASISGVDDCKPSTSGLRYPMKRPRKTFRLNVDADEEPLQNSEASSSSTFMDKVEGRISVKSSSLNHVATTVRDAKGEGDSSTNSPLESKGERPVIVSSFEDDVKDNAASPRQTIDEDLCVIESSSTSRLNRGRGNAQPLKPPPLRMKKKPVRGRGKVASVEKESQKDQVDDSEPTQQVVSSNLEGAETPVEEEELECPLCQKLFPRNIIEVHASSCGELVAEEEPQHPAGNSLRGRRKNAQPVEDRIQASTSDEDVKVARIISRREGTPPNCARCFHCKLVFKEGDEYVVHIQDCQAKVAAEMSSLGSRTPGRGQRSHRVMSPHTSRMGRTPVAQSASVFDRLEGVSEIQFHQGDITDLVYSKPNTALTHIINCVAVRPHGLSQVLADKYPYSNTYKTRRPIGNLNRSCLSDRDTPGTIKICRSKSEPQKTPVVVNIFGQFYMGKTYNRNFMSKRLVWQMKKGNLDVNHTIPANNCVSGRNADYDGHLVNGIESDTQMNRIKWFKEALQQLIKEIPRENITRVVFPFKIGCGLAEGNWEKDYYPAIQEFHRFVSQSGVEVIIVRKVENVLSDPAAVPQETLRFSSPNSTLPHKLHPSQATTKQFPSPRDGPFPRTYPEKGKPSSRGRYSPDVWRSFARESQS